MNLFPFFIKIETAFTATKTNGFNGNEKGRPVVGCTLVSYTYTTH
jgi:hypothetical protein